MATTKQTPWRKAGGPNDGCCHSAGIEDAAGVHVADVADEEDVALIAAAPALAEALEKAADTLRDAAAAYHFFGKHVAAEAMEIAERHSRAVLRAAGTLP